MKEVTQKWMVTIPCFTYNQSSYICDTLNGFVMQQTDFPFVILVVDDASTDGEQDVIRAYVKEQFDLENINIAYEKNTDYASITYAQHKTNKNCYIVIHYLKENHYSNSELSAKKMSYLVEWRDNTKYEALCEGDDYWIDPKKLQKQVSFLDKNLEYGLVYTRASHLIQSRYFFNEEDESRVSFKDLIKTNPIRTLTIMYRKSLYNRYNDFLKNSNMPNYDYTLFLWFSYYSNIGYISDITGVYRVVEESASHSTTDTNKIISFKTSCFKIREYWANKTGIDITPLYIGYCIECYKYLIIKNDINNIVTFRRKILDIDDKLLIPFKYRFLSYTKSDLFFSIVIKIFKPILKLIRSIFWSFTNK